METGLTVYQYQQNSVPIPPNDVVKDAGINQTEPTEIVIKINAEGYLDTDFKYSGPMQAFLCQLRQYYGRGIVSPEDGVYIFISGSGNLRMTIEDFLDFKDVKKNSRKTYRNQLKHFFDWMRKNRITLPIMETVKAYRDSMKEEEGKSADTVNNYLRAVKAFFRWTAATGIYPDVTAGVKDLKVSKDYKKDELKQSGASAVLAAMPRETVLEKRNFAMLGLMLTAGLRTVEISRLRVQDLVFHGPEATIHIWGKGQDSPDKSMGISVVVTRAISEYLEARGSAEPDEPLFRNEAHNHRGEPISTNTVSKTAKNAFKAVGLDSPKLTAHSTRHTTARELRRAGFHTDEIQGFTRHANLENVLIYSKMEEEESSKYAETLERAFFSEAEIQRAKAGWSA